MNLVQAQRERALTDARHRVQEYELLIYAWERRLESFVGAHDVERDPIALEVAGELAATCRERSGELRRLLAVAQGDVDRMVASITAAAKVRAASVA